MTKQEKRELFRAEFPLSAESADLFRDLFGDGVRLVYAEENGKTIGRQYNEDRHNEIYNKKKGAA